MKKIITFIFGLLIVDFSNAQAPNSWTEKNALGFNKPSSSLIKARQRAAGFSIAGKGYVGTGVGANINIKLNDFWEYDPSTNAWTQKANFGGTAREAAVGLSIGNKGYFGTGNDNNGYRNDFWEYDPLVNTWTQKTNFGGVGRNLATGLSIGNKGYIGTGNNSSGYKNDFWEYDPLTNAWTQKADFGGTPRFGASGFSIGSKGYIGIGYDGTMKNDFWEYDPLTNAWAQKANFGGTPRYYAAGFNISNKGYIGTGYDGTVKKDFWEYDAAADMWTQKPDLGGLARQTPVAFSIGNNGYIYGGINSTYSIEECNNIWEFNSAVNTWTEKINNSSISRFGAVGFNIGSKGYVGTGRNKKDFWEYDPATNTWTQKADFGGIARTYATGFSIGNKGYIGIGRDSVSPYLKNDFWEYDPATNTWTQKANFGGGPRGEATGFSIGNKGYIGTGAGISNLFNDLWEFNPVTNSWTQKATIMGYWRRLATGFSIGNKGYLGTGYNGSDLNDFWEYDPSANSWTQKANFGGTSRNGPAGFSIGNKGYMGVGSGQDFWEYDPATNMWTQTANFGGVGRLSPVNFSIGGKGYSGTGVSSGPPYLNDFWEFTPTCLAPAAIIYSSGNISFCSGDSVFLYANNGYNYQWKKNGIDITGATSYFYYAKTVGSYTCYLTNSCGAATSGAIAVTVNVLPSATITPAGPTTFCSGGSVVLNAPIAANRTYQWKKGVNLISGATLSSYTATTGGNYRVIVTNTVTGCSKSTGSATVVTVNAPPPATITPQGPTTFCAGGSVVLAANTGTGLTYKWKKGSNFISGATLSNYTATTVGNYRVQLTNNNGCSKTSAGVTVTVPCKEGESAVSVNDFDVKVYPNPSSGDFTFEIINTNDKNIFIAVYDAIGKKIRFDQLKRSTANYQVSNLLPGVFSAEIICGANKKVIKLVKTQ